MTEEKGGISFAKQPQQSDRLNVKEGALPTWESDRRLYLTADKKRVVEEGDVESAFLFAIPGQRFTSEEVARYKLGPQVHEKAPPAPEELVSDEEPNEEKAADKPADKQAARPQNKARTKE